MFSKNFAPDSFIYRFLAWPGEYLYTRPRTICELRTWVFLKLVGLALGVSLFFGYITSMASYLLYYFVCNGPSDLSCTYALNKFSKLGGGFLTVTAFIAIVGAIMFVFIKASFAYDQYRRRTGKSVGKYVGSALKVFVLDEENLVRLMYVSWKDKLCYQVTFSANPEVEPKQVHQTESA